MKGEYSGEKVGFHKAVKGDIESIQQIELVDQNPIGKSSQEQPVTYIKLMTKYVTFRQTAFE